MKDREEVEEIEKEVVEMVELVKVEVHRGDMQVLVNKGGQGGDSGVPLWWFE